MTKQVATRFHRSCSEEHQDFLPLATRVLQHARVVFRGYGHVEAEELAAEAVAAAFKSYVGLKERGKDPVREFPSAMATFSVRHVYAGRRVGGKCSSKDVLSVRAQRKHGFKVHSLPTSAGRNNSDVAGERRRLESESVLAERCGDNTRTPVAEQAAFRIDFAAFLETMSHRDRALAEFLAQGHSAKQAAARFNLSAPRVTQLRQQWHRRWREFHGELADPSSASAGKSLRT